jgi:hypothetical protein
VAAEIGGQRVEHVHRVELRLVGQQRAAVEGKRDVERVHPAHAEAHGLGRVMLFARGFDLGLRRRVRHGVAGLERDVVVRAEAQQPLLSLQVRRHVGLDDTRGLQPQHPGQLGALKQGELAGGVAGRHGAHVARLDDGDPPTGSGEQQGGGQAGQTCADHEVVDAFWKRIGRRRQGAVEPQRRHTAPAVSRMSTP